ncbi:hypothetical protein D9758_006242 [Tetrapyrgos nigripes]|uniref:Protein kinase domain-containing protein n=1 Tax=Tetrapyrgos nigripes TaxID=182062 RepID=A0A8H5GAQ8_9AGAR|nr:hypothetical protein D9758_006242 [Tetrapyrgos nigripes]
MLACFDREHVDVSPWNIMLGTKSPIMGYEASLSPIASDGDPESNPGQLCKLEDGTSVFIHPSRPHFVEPNNIRDLAWWNSSTFVLSNFGLSISSISEDVSDAWAKSVPALLWRIFGDFPPGLMQGSHSASFFLDPDTGGSPQVQPQKPNDEQFYKMLEELHHHEALPGVKERFGPDPRSRVTLDEIMERITEGQVVLSGHCRDFLLKMLDLDSYTRATAEELLHHPWLIEP